jgi:uncharacterized membrane protein
MQGINRKKIGLTLLQTSMMAAVYASVTVVLGGFSYSWVQIRLSESLTPLPFLMGLPAVLGLALGCLIANMFSPLGLPDMIFGPLLTLFAALMSWKATAGRKSLACIYPVLVNAIGVSLYVSSFYNTPYLLSVATIAFGEFISAVVIGYPLLKMVEKLMK